ncbi:rubredoxin [Gracilimonas mengyeensis]|uniref:Nitrite/Sulfite reductase ferredoxin-like half domain-containing protein n=1 Tax=Gracilimonas mengyeensis TaxID=1302730 RepID=A0A521BMA8_9BACT|nr:rubredoxin [Gracilimonas mengyeensis]SMO47770.1 Nitrite/Sulfite reductase ferredoxin-like half domain-containing protein [Gracilimonas mengyeensis]
MNKNDLIRAFTPGGLLSPRDLQKIVGIARDLGNDTVHFGSRQDIMFVGSEVDQLSLDEEFGAIGTHYEWSGQRYQNIVTSFVAVDIVPTTPWVTAGTYYNVLDTFDYRPRLKINITDPKQSLVPLFNGQLNFVASPHEDYWYLFLKFNPESNLQRWPVLIYSQDIGKISAKIEAFYFDTKAPDTAKAHEVFDLINPQTEANNRTIDQELELPAEPSPYYEGWHKMSGNKYWLGLYWRNNRYTISFLEKVCELCIKTNIGKIILTPWKSFIVKDISGEDRAKWEALCGSNGINLRHSSLELNWHLPVLNEHALKLKRYLVSEFDQNDISTYGLTFSIKERPVNLFTSVVIIMHPEITFFGKYVLRYQYHVYYSKNFNPNEETYIPYAKYLHRKDLPNTLMELSQSYYTEAYKDEEDRIWEEEEPTPETIKGGQCPNCMTIYHPHYGEPEAKIPEGTPFADLPDSYTCLLCDTPKSAFEEIEIGLPETMV